MIDRIRPQTRPALDDLEFFQLRHDLDRRSEKMGNPLGGDCLFEACVFDGCTDQNATVMTRHHVHPARMNHPTDWTNLSPESNHLTSSGNYFHEHSKRRQQLARPATGRYDNRARIEALPCRNYS